MYSLFSLAVLALGLAGIEANPVAVVERSIHTSTIQSSTGSFTGLDKRTTTQLGNFNVSTQSNKTQLFFVQVSPDVKLTVDCNDCQTWGMVKIASSHDSSNSTEADSINKSVSGREGSSEIVIDLGGVGALFDFSVIVGATAVYTFQIFESETEAGIALPNGDQIGLVFTLNLIFSISDSMNFTGGFEVNFPPSASVTINSFSGDIIDFNLGGVVVEALPVSVTTGPVTLDMSLQAKVQLGTTLAVRGTGVIFEVGAFVNLVNFKILIDESDDCTLGITETLDVDMAAYAKEAVEIDSRTWGVMPSVATTVAATTLGSSCLIASTTVAPAMTQTCTMSLLESVLVNEHIPAPTAIPTAVIISQ